MPLMGLLGVGIERFAYRPLRNAPRLAPLITAIGVSFILQNVIQVIYGPSPKSVPQIFPLDWPVHAAGCQHRVAERVHLRGHRRADGGPAPVRVAAPGSGRAMRSTAQDREAAQLMGVNINTTIALTFLLGSALAGAAGIVYGLNFGTIEFTLGFSAGLKAFTAAVLGGIGNLDGRRPRRLHHRLHRGHHRAAGLCPLVARPWSSRCSSSCWCSDRPASWASSWVSGHDRAGDRRVQAAHGRRAGAAPSGTSRAVQSASIADDHRGHGPGDGPSCRSSSLLPPFSGFARQTVWIDSFATAGVFVLLALGLNVVVGMAGLLDLGYAAFFAIGAYAYAYGASSFTGLHIPFWSCCPSARSSRRVFGILLGAPTLRLRGDYLAIVTLGFGEIVPVVFKNADKWTNGTNGIAGISRLAQTRRAAGRASARRSPIAYYLVMAVIDHGRHDPALPAPGLASRPLLAGHPRG